MPDPTKDSNPDDLPGDASAASGQGSAPTPPHPEACDQPPSGWRCTREPGHDGPCAAVPNGADETIADRLRHLVGVINAPPYEMHTGNPWLGHAAAVMLDAAESIEQMKKLVRAHDFYDQVRHCEEDYDDDAVGRASMAVIVATKAARKLLGIPDPEAEAFARHTEDAT